MINAWSLLYEEMNGTMDKTYPIKENVMSDIKINLEGADEGVVNVPSDINLDSYTDAFDHLMDDKKPWIYESPDNGKTVYRYERGTDPLKRELVENKTPGIEVDCPRKYKEDDAIKALQDYISTTYNGHYTSKQNNVQTLDLIESVGDAEAFCRSNAIKYLSRYDKKGQAKRDILKALHYSLLLYHFSGQLNETPTRGYETF